MRRNTISNTSLPRPSSSRLSLSRDETKRRDKRILRDKQNMQDCLESIFYFLTENKQPIPSSLTSHCPSAKDVQSLYKFMYALIDPSYKFNSVNFGDDVITTLKFLKYPYLTEINKSQFVAVTPHSWPVILSMLGWLTKIHSMKFPEPEESVDRYFYEFLIEGYQAALNEQSDIEMEENFIARCDKFVELRFGDIEQKQEIVDKINEKIATFKEEMMSESVIESSQIDATFIKHENIKKQPKREFLKNYISHLDGAIKTTEEKIKELDFKRKKYEIGNEKKKKEIINFENQSQNLQQEAVEIKKLIDAQGIEPLTLQQMNKEKNECYNELERLKPLKHSKKNEIAELKNNLAKNVEEMEKIVQNLKNLKDVDLKIQKETRDGLKFYKINGDIEDCKKSIEDQIVDLKDLKCELNEEIYNLQLKKQEQEEEITDLVSKIEMTDNEILRLGQIYLDKKEKYNKLSLKRENEFVSLKNEILKSGLEFQMEEDIISNKIKLEEIKLEKLKKEIENEKKNIETSISELNDFLLSNEEDIKKLVDNL